MDAILVGDYMKELRENKRLSQKEVADILGVSRQAVSNWERGRTLPGLKDLYVLSRIYGKTINEIIEAKK